MQQMLYRLRQVRQQLGFIRPLTTQERAEVEEILPSQALPLFQVMSAADQQHGYRVCKALQAQGCTEDDLLQAALLHDVGKAIGKIPFWTRPAIVICKRLSPRLLPRITVSPQKLTTTLKPRWKRVLSYAWHHAEVGAILAEKHGLSEQAVLYIRTHHQPNGPAAWLHQVDEES